MLAHRVPALSALRVGAPERLGGPLDNYTHALMIRQEAFPAPRRYCHRRIVGQPAAAVFTPVDIPAALLDEVVMTRDEFEAIRLAHLEKFFNLRAGEMEHDAVLVYNDHAPQSSLNADAASKTLFEALVGDKEPHFDGFDRHFDKISR